MKRKILSILLFLTLLLPVIDALTFLVKPACASPKSLYLVADHHTAQFDAWEVKPDGTVEYQATYLLTHATDPAGISMDESSATLFITSEFSGGVEMVDATTMTSLGVSVGPEDLAGIDVDDENDIVYTVQRSEPGFLYVYDWDPVASNLTLREGYPKVLENCQSSFGLALDDTRGILWVADPEAGVVRAYDVATCLTTGSWVEDTSRSFMPSHKPVDIAVDRTRGFVYSVSMSYGAGTPPGTGSNILSKYELATGIETTGTLADQGVGVSVDEVTGYVYLTLSPYGRNLTQGDLEVWDTSTNPWTLIQTSKVSGSPAGIYVPNPEVSYNPLHLSKSDTPDPVLPGETITYTIAYDNLGNDFDVHNVIITDYLSAQTIFVSASDGGVYNSANHTVVWNIGTLPALSGPYSRTLTALVKEDVNEPIIVNYVTIDCDETPPTTICEDTVVGGVHDIAISNVTSSKTVVGQGFSSNINVTVENQGTYTETFNVTLYAQPQGSINQSVVLSDNFDDNVLDTSKWTVLSGGGTSSINETNQRIEISTDGHNRVYLKTAQPVYSTPCSIEVDTYFATSNSPWSQVVIRWDGQITGYYDEPKNGIWVALEDAWNVVDITKFVNGFGVSLNHTTFYPSYNIWYHLKITDDGETIKVYVNGTLIVQAKDTFSGGNYLGLFSRESVNVIYFDNFLMQAPIETGLVGYWKFDEGGGTIAYDSSGNNNHGTLMNDPTWIDGKIGKALSFDGIDDCVEFSEHEPYFGLNETKSGTIMGWFFVETYPTSWTELFDVSSNAVFFLHADPIYLAGCTTGVSESYPMGYVWCLREYPISNIIGRWAHIAFTSELNEQYTLDPTDPLYNSSATYSLYIDGTLVAQSAGPPILALDIHTPIAQINGGGTYWQGKVDEVKIFNRALSAEEIWSEYARSLTPIQTQNIALDAGSWVTVTFTWNTSGFSKGNYTFLAYAWPVPGETDTADNAFVDGFVIVAMVGDVTGPDGWPDGKVNMRDIGAISRCFGSQKGDPDYNANYDITGPTEGLADGKINMRDVGLASRHFGEIDP